MFPKLERMLLPYEGAATTQILPVKLPKLNQISHQ
jgi:hypothetical protein